MTGSTRYGGVRDMAAPQPVNPLVICAFLLALSLAWLTSIRGTVLPITYFREQDLPVLVGLVVAAIALALVRPGVRTGSSPAVYALRPSPRDWALLLGVMALLLWWGAYALLSGYALTRDELMVRFDMAVFGEGRFAEPIAEAWRPYATALVPAFLLQPHDPVGLTSAYLPGNAMLRLVFSYIADPALFNPLLAAIGGLALLDIARRQFGASNGAVIMVMLLYVTSAQMLVTAMTVFAMTPHLALNLIWLAAFLRGGRLGHAVAILAGAWACGLHQLVFHPLFVAPFIVWKAARGERRVALLYVLAYAVICIGWVCYPAFVAQWTSVPGVATDNADFLRSRVLPLLLEREPYTLQLMGFNLTRFLAWQNLALLPLMIAAWPAIRRDEGIAAPLMAGLILTIVVVGLLLPYQAYGWGYRYLHGLIGSCALLGGYGWLRFRQSGAGAVPAVAVLTGLTVLGAIPWLAYQSYAFSRPFVVLEDMIRQQRTDMVLVDTFEPTLMIDMVRNEPDLGNRPLRFSALQLKPRQLAALCEKGTITIVTRADMHRGGLGLTVAENSPKFEALIAPFKANGCLRAASWAGMPQ